MVVIRYFAINSALQVTFDCCASEAISFKKSIVLGKNQKLAEGILSMGDNCDFDDPLGESEDKCVPYDDGKIQREGFGNSRND